MIRSSQAAFILKEHLKMKDKIFIEPHKDGGFGAKHAGGQRVFEKSQTQGGLIKEVKAMHPDAELHVARVRNVGPGPDKFRKA